MSLKYLDLSWTCNTGIILQVVIHILLFAEHAEC